MFWLLLVGWFVLSVPVCLLLGRSITAAQATLAAADAALQQATSTAPCAEARHAAV